ncbi:MAG: hypothetical protein EA385_00955 [Salinarimonadaceae bacterium]|nr:MAG: hypothetical protein EA385_00955 [Salinarimonadaceae bacterium]
MIDELCTEAKMTNFRADEDGNSARFRAGLLIPSSNTTIEREYNAIGPERVSWHFGRLTMTKVDQEGIESQDAEIDAEARKLGAARPHATLLCQSAASFVMGRDYDDQLARRIADATGGPALVAGVTMTDLLEALGVERIALATPFTTEVNALTTGYFQAAGFSVVGVSGLGIVTNFDIAALAEADLTALATSVDCSDAQAIVMPGGNMPCLAHLVAMEAAVGKPIITTNLAGMWAISKKLGFPLRGERFGRSGAL